MVADLLIDKDPPDVIFNFYEPGAGSNILLFLVFVNDFDDARRERREERAVVVENRNLAAFRFAVY